MKIGATGTGNIGSRKVFSREERGFDLFSPIAACTASITLRVQKLLQDIRHHRLQKIDES